MTSVERDPNEFRRLIIAGLRASSRMCFAIVLARITRRPGSWAGTFVMTASAISGTWGIPIETCPGRELLHCQGLQWENSEFICGDEDPNVHQGNLFHKLCVAWFVLRAGCDGRTIEGDRIWSTGSWLISTVIIVSNVEVGHDAGDCVWSIVLYLDDFFGGFLKMSANRGRCESISKSP